MTTAIALRDDKRDPAKASGRCRRAAEHYVRNGCKAIGPSMIWAGYAPMTSREPSKNGFHHDWLVAVARYWNKGSRVTAQAHLSKAIKALADMVEDTQIAPQARGAAAKTIIDVAQKEKAESVTVETTAEEQAKWMTLIRHWKRTFLRRGLRMGMDATEGIQTERTCRILARLEYLLGKGPRPEGWGEEEDGDESVQRPEGDTRPTDYLDAEVVEEPEA